MLVIALSLCACAADTEPHSIASVESPLPSTKGKQLALGKAHGCSLDAAVSGVRCWGDNRRGQTSVPLLTSPTFVAAGGDTSCAISGGVVLCWGDNSHGQLLIPLDALGSKELTVGAGHVCALSDRGAVSCWGDNTKGQTRAPSLRAETIAAGARHTCALAGSTVRCWGDNSQRQLEVPALVAPKQLVSGGDHSCVIDSGRIVCWGSGAALPPDRLPIEPSLIATGASHTCVLSTDGVQCWGDPIAGDLTPRELTQTVQLAVGGGDGWDFACARHLQGVACWGSSNFAQINYDGGELHVLHRSESRIAAPSARVWDIIMDLDRYPQWNPYTTSMKSTLTIGDPMVMNVKMSELLTIEQTEYIRALEPGHKVCWGIDTTTPEFNSGERCQWLEELPGGGTHYINEDLIEGTANPLVTALFGDAVQNGFDAVALALKKRAE